MENPYEKHVKNSLKLPKGRRWLKRGERLSRKAGDLFIFRTQKPCKVEAFDKTRYPGFEAGFGVARKIKIVETEKTR